MGSCMSPSQQADLISQADMGDSAELLRLAIRQREEGFLHPGMPDYDAKLQEMWGGPQMRMYPQALEQFPRTFAMQRGRIALVTGGTGGIGFYVAKLLANIGLKLILPSRPGLSHEADGAVAAIRKEVPDAKVVVPEIPLDLGSFTSVRAFSAHLCSDIQEQCIDVLCCNAGRGGSATAPMEARTSDGREPIMQVNTLGHALLVAELLPLLRKSEFARLTFQSSGARFNVPQEQYSVIDGEEPRATPWSQYSKSKAGMCLLARALTPRLDAVGVHGAAAAADPGLLATGVNVQHNLAHTIGATRRGISDTKHLHDSGASHAADGALPISLACLDCKPDEFFHGAGHRSRSLSDAAGRLRVGSDDPMGWPTPVVEQFWKNVLALVPGMSQAFPN